MREDERRVYDDAIRLLEDAQRTKEHEITYSHVVSNGKVASDTLEASERA